MPITPPFTNPAEPGQVYSPSFFRLQDPADKQRFKELIGTSQVLFTYDEIDGQLRELIKSHHPSIRIKPEDFEGLVAMHLGGVPAHDYGVWVYYPWSRRLVHLLDENEFTEVRTNRNQYKITRQEQDILRTKKIGIVGLSVGQSIALTLTMERGYGELRLADFDKLELSNLNRIRAGVHQLGLPKVVIAAREIAEIDPFLKVTCFFDGLTEANMDAFFTDGGKLDILVDECDGLDMKLIARFKARELGVPVVMDTSDRGMLDVERFDLEPDRPLLHGTVTGINPGNIRELSNEDKVPIILQMLGVDNISLRAKASMLEVEQSINTWPQLASSVALGGAAGADVCRRILLDQFRDSGRYYIDFEEIVPDTRPEDRQATAPVNPFQPLMAEDLRNIAALHAVPAGTYIPDKTTITELVRAATAAPSTGNDQPWKWLYRKGVLYIFQDDHRSFSFGDYRGIASNISFGAAFENLYIHALNKGIEAVYGFTQGDDAHPLVAAIHFRPAVGQLQAQLARLDEVLFKRHTNRNQAPKTILPQEKLNQLTAAAESIPGARLQWFTDRGSLDSLARIIGYCDRVRLLSPEGHHDFVHREMRWTTEEAESTKDGIDIHTLGLSNSQLAALGVIKNAQVVRTINTLDGGKALDMLAKRTVSTASAICLLTLSGNSDNRFFEGGRAMERLWLEATTMGLAVHPLISPLYLFPRIVQGNGEGLEPKFIPELLRLREDFLSLTGIEPGSAEVFLAKIAVAPEPELKSFRLPLTEVFYLD